MGNQFKKQKQMQNLAYIGSDKKVHTIKVGMLGNTMQKKEEDLQNLGYIGQDGTYHGNNMLQKKLMNLAYLNEDGKVVSKNTGLLGAVKPMNLK